MFSLFKTKPEAEKLQKKYELITHAGMAFTIKR